MGALIAAAVADQRSGVPQSSVRSKIAEILARQGRQTFFSERTLPTTYRSPSQSTSRALKTRLAPSRTEASLLTRGRVEQLYVTRFHAPHAVLIGAPRGSLHVFRGVDSCSSWYECFLPRRTRRRLYRTLFRLSEGRLRLATKRAPVDRELTGRFRVPLPLASILKGRRLKRSGGFVKSPSAALRFIFHHCSVLLCTPHSSRFARLASGAFYCAVYSGDFLRSHQASCWPARRGAHFTLAQAASASVAAGTTRLRPPSLAR